MCVEVWGGWVGVNTTLPYGVKVEGRGEVGGSNERWVGYPTAPTLPYGVQVGY